MRTATFGDGPVELGANWIHGACLANPVFALANQESVRRPGLLRGVSTGGELVSMDRRKGFFFTPEGRCIGQKLGEKVGALLKRNAVHIDAPSLMMSSLAVAESLVVSRFTISPARLRGAWTPSTTRASCPRTRAPPSSYPGSTSVS